MNDTPESSGTPTADQADAFLRKVRDSEPTRLRQKVVELYKDSESIGRALQMAVLQNNPVLQDNRSLQKRFGLLLGNEPDLQGQALAAMGKGEFSLDYLIGGGGEPVDTEQQKIILEGYEISGISMRNSYIGPSVNNETFRDGHVYEIELQINDPQHPPRDLGEGLYKAFYITDQGDWMVVSELGDVHQPVKSKELTPNDVDVKMAEDAIQILKSRLSQALASGGPGASNN